MKPWLSSLCCCLLLAAVLPAAADTSSGRANALSRQGQAQLDAGHFETACAKFEASEALENSVGTLLHLGDCYERAGRSASAWHTFLEAEAVARAKKDTDLQQIAALRVAALRPHLASVVFVIPANSRVPGLSVQLGANAIPASSWGVVIPVDAGTQHVSVSANGYKPWYLDLNVSSSEPREYRVTVPQLAVAPRPASNRRRDFRTAGVVTSGAGIAGIGAGALLSALSRNADDAGTCARGVVQCTPIKTDRSQNSEAAAVSFALGGALLAAGVTLFVLAPSPDEKEKDAALRVTAHVASNGGRLQMEGAW